MIDVIFSVEFMFLLLSCTLLVGFIGVLLMILEDNNAIEYAPSTVSDWSRRDAAKALRESNK